MWVLVLALALYLCYQFAALKVLIISIMKMSKTEMLAHFADIIDGIVCRYSIMDCTQSVWVLLNLTVLPLSLHQRFELAQLSWLNCI